MAMRKSIWRVSVIAGPENEPAVAALLEERLETPVAIHRDEATGRLTITAYPKSIPVPPARLRAALTMALRDLGLVRPKISVRPLRNEDWANSWKRHFKPIEIGRALLIKPSWSRRRAKPGQRVVVLDPGLSFGTGQHATTHFCLSQLSRCRHPGRRQSFLDIGTGSGILAIAAAKRGYSPVTAIDHDPAAIRTAAANARRNRVEAKISLRRADLTRPDALGARRYDVICANLTDDLLVAEAGKIAARLKPDGRLVLAGILAGQFQAVTEKLHFFGLTLEFSELENTWCSGQFAFWSG